MFIKVVAINKKAMAKAVESMPAGKKLTCGDLFEHYVGLVYNGVVNGGNKSGNDVTLSETITFKGAQDFKGNYSENAALVAPAGSDIECKCNYKNYANFGNGEKPYVSDVKEAAENYAGHCEAQGTSVFMVQFNEKAYAIMDREAFQEYIEIVHLDSHTSHSKGYRPTHKVGRHSRFEKAAAAKGYASMIEAIPA